MVKGVARNLKALFPTKTEEWKGLLRKHAPIAQQMVRKLVEGRIVFTPDREARRYSFLATGTLANSSAELFLHVKAGVHKGVYPIYRRGAGRQ